MSVVNKMLRDLEARQATAQTFNADYQPPAKSASWLWWLLALGVMVLAFGLFRQYWSAGSTNPVPESLAQTSNTEQQSAAPKTMQVAETSLKPKPTDLAGTDINSSTTHEQPQTAAVNDAQTADTMPRFNAPDSGTIAVAETVSKEDSVQSMTPAATHTQPTTSFAITDSNPANQADNLKQQIKDALATGNTSQASHLLTQLHQLQPDNVEVLKKLASLEFANGNVVSATRLLQQSIDAFPQRSDIRLMLARLYTQQNQSDRALAILSAHSPPPHMQIDYLAFRANLAQQMGQLQQANQDYNKLSQADPNNARWWLGLAITEEKAGSVDAALRSYHQAQNLAQLEPAVADFIRQRIDVLAGVK